MCILYLIHHLPPPITPHYIEVTFALGHLYLLLFFSPGFSLYLLFMPALLLRWVFCYQSAKFSATLLSYYFLALNECVNYFIVFCPVRMCASSNKEVYPSCSQRYCLIYLSSIEDSGGPAPR